MILSHSYSFQHFLLLNVLVEKKKREKLKKKVSVAHFPRERSTRGAIIPRGSSRKKKKKKKEAVPIFANESLTNKTTTTSQPVCQLTVQPYLFAKTFFFEKSDVTCLCF